MKVTAKDLRLFLKEILDTVTRGEEVIITYRGKSRAKIIPLEPKITPQTNLYGIWRDNDTTKDVYKHLRDGRKPRFVAN